MIEWAIEAPIGTAALVALLFCVFLVCFQGKDDSWTSPGPYKWAIAFTMLAIVSLLLGGGVASRSVDFGY